MNSYREAQRLGQMESTLRQEQEKYQQRRDTGTGNRRNQSQVQYDLMTLDYKSTPGGQALKQQVRAGGRGVQRRVLWCFSWHLAADCALLRGRNSNSQSAWLIRKIGLPDSGGRSLLACALVILPAPNLSQTPALLLYAQDALIAEQQQQRFDMLYTKVNRTTHNIITGQLLPPRQQ